METETYLFNDTFDHNLALEIIDNLQDFSPRGFNAFFSTFESDLKNEKKNCRMDYSILNSGLSEEN